MKDHILISTAGSVDKAVHPMAPALAASSKLLTTEKTSPYQATGISNPSNKSTGTGTLEKQATLKAASKDGNTMRYYADLT